MEDLKVIKGNSIEEVWAQIDKDFEGNQELFVYGVVIEQEGRSVEMDIDIDLGGGFEGGYALTRFVSNLKRFDDFRFSLHRQDFIDEIGKLFGMQDIKINYPEFDRDVMVKANHEDRIKDILSDQFIREVILSLPDFNFHIGHHHSDNTEVESAFLELRIEDGITNSIRLRDIYKAFILVLDKVDLNKEAAFKYNTPF